MFRVEIRCVLFDFDKTLVNIDDFVDWRGAKEAVIKSYIESGIPKDVVSKFQSSMTMLSQVYEYMLSHYSHQKALRIQRRVSGSLARFEIEAARKGQLLPGAKEILDWLSTKGIKTGIFSSNSSDSIGLALKRLSVIRYVNAIVGRSPPLRMKPHPDQLRVCLQKLNCSPEHAVAVGDRTYDIMAAKSLGIPAVAVAAGKSSKEDLLAIGPWRVISTLVELREILMPLIRS